MHRERGRRLSSLAARDKLLTASVERRVRSELERLLLPRSMTIRSTASVKSGHRARYALTSRDGLVI
jgi:hypothetical protein